MLSIAVVFLLFLLISLRYVESSFYVRAGVVALASHIFVAYLFLPILPYGLDIGNFHNVGVGLLGGGYPSASTTVTAFGTFQGLLYAVFGIDTTTISVINSLFAVLIPIPAVYITRKLYGPQIVSTHGVVALLLFLPLPLLFLTIPMRESLTTLLVFVVLALLVHILTERAFVLALPLVPLWGLTYLLRPEWGFVLLLGLLAGAALLCYEALEIQTNILSLLAVGGVIGGVGLTLFAEYMYSFERVNAELTHRASGGAVYLEGMTYGSWLEFLIAAPARAIYFQFAPFPLHVETAFHLLGFVSSMYIIVFAIAAGRSLYTCQTDRVVVVTLLVVYFAGIAGYGLINSNFGTNVRHRIPFVFLLIVFAAPVIQRWELAVRQWFSVRPDEYEQHAGEQQKAQKADSDV